MKNSVIAVQTFSQSNRKGVDLYFKDGTISSYDLTEIEKFLHEYPEFNEFYSVRYIYPNKIGKRYILQPVSDNRFQITKGIGTTLYIYKDKVKDFENIFR